VLPRLTEIFFNQIGYANFLTFPVFLVILSYLIRKKMHFFLDKALFPLYSQPRGGKWMNVEEILSV